jgi:hypothetical protein
MGENVVEMGICPLCNKPMNSAHPDAVDFNGQLVHLDCDTLALDRQQQNNNSYT